MSKIEFSLKTPHSVSNLHLRIKGVYCGNLLYKMKEVSHNFFQVFIEESELPQEELQYHFTEILEHTENVIPHTFMASKTNFTVKNFSHVNRGSHLEIFNLQFKKFSIYEKSYLSLCFSSKLKNISKIILTFPDSTQIISDRFYSSQENLLFSEVIPLQEGHTNFSLEFHYNNQVYFLDALGSLSSKPQKISLEDTSLLKIDQESNQRAILFSKRDYEHIFNLIPLIANLGFTEVHLPPVFESYSSHGYDWINFGKFDPSFCSQSSYKKLINKIHTFGLGVIQDICITHCHEKASFFQKAINDPQGPYSHFFIKDDLRSGEYKRYVGIDDLPLLNLENSEVQKYFTQEILSFIKEFNIDGARFDSGHIIPGSFYQTLREALSFERKKTFKILYETWSTPLPHFSQAGHHFTNYLLRERVFLDFMRGANVEKFINNISNFLNILKSDLFMGHTFISSHDTLSVEDFQTYRFFLFLSYMIPGIPMLYIDEVESFLHKDEDQKQILLNDIRFLNTFHQNILPTDYNSLTIIPDENYETISLEFTSNGKKLVLIYNPTKKIVQLPLNTLRLHPKEIYYELK